MDKVEVQVSVTAQYAYPNHDWEAKVTEEVKVEADISALLTLPFEELCHSLAYKALIEFRTNELEKEAENESD